MNTELRTALTMIRGNVSMIDASPAGSLNDCLKRQALVAISDALEKVYLIEDCVPLDDVKEASQER